MIFWQTRPSLHEFRSLLWLISDWTNHLWPSNSAIFSDDHPLNTSCYCFIIVLCFSNTFLNKEKNKFNEAITFLFWNTHTFIHVFGNCYEMDALFLCVFRWKQKFPPLFHKFCGSWNEKLCHNNKVRNT
jgi:hypothetical protein